MPSRSPSAISPYSYQTLRANRLAESTREFLARGKSVQRCARCLMAEFACLCEWTPRIKSECEFILLMHRNEVFKPTNTGRLISDVLPENTSVFCWDRTDPHEVLLELLLDPNRECLIVFPLENLDLSDQERNRVTELSSNNKIKTFILLDGTWKQGRRMFNFSRWLDDIPCVVLPTPNQRGYSVRQSHQDHCVSTAEAAALCLQMANEISNADILRDYFSLFHLHCLATRASAKPDLGELHHRLAALNQSVD